MYLGLFGRFAIDARADRLDGLPEQRARGAVCGLDELLRRARDRLWLVAEHRDVRQIPVLLGVVQPVADDESILNAESDVLDGHVHLPP